VLVAPPVGKAIGKGRFTTGFLARLLCEKFVLGRPAHRIVAALGLGRAGAGRGHPGRGVRRPLVAAGPTGGRDQRAQLGRGEFARRRDQLERVRCGEGKDSHRWWWPVFVGPDTTVFRIAPSRSLAVLAEQLGIDTDAEALPEGRALLGSSDFYTGALPCLHPAAAKVLATLDREWDGLARHREYPELPLDNNTSERALRGPVIGRKNYYGSGSVVSAQLASRVWTITATAGRAGLHPLTYLGAYLDACAQAGGTAPQGQALARFLPWAAGDTDLTAWRQGPHPPGTHTGATTPGADLHTAGPAP
jgi:hypothetical protein